MREVLEDIVRHTNKADIKGVRVIGNDTSTKVFTMTPDQSTVYINGVIKSPVSEFKGEWGIQNLELLQQYLTFAPFRVDKAKLTIKKRKQASGEFPESIRFQAPTGTDMVFRFCPATLVPEANEFSKSSAKWKWSFTPSRSKVNEMTQIHSMLAKYHPTFHLAVEDDNLVFVLGEGDTENHTGKSILVNGIDGEISSGLHWKAKEFLQIVEMGLFDNKVEVKIDPRGILAVETESDVGTWGYYFLGEK